MLAPNILNLFGPERLVKTVAVALQTQAEVAEMNSDKLMRQNIGNDVEIALVVFNFLCKAVHQCEYCGWYRLYRYVAAVTVHDGETELTNVLGLSMKPRISVKVLEYLPESEKWWDVPSIAPHF